MPQWWAQIKMPHKTPQNLSATSSFRKVVCVPCSHRMEFSGSVKTSKQVSGQHRALEQLWGSWQKEETREKKEMGLLFISSLLIRDHWMYQCVYGWCLTCPMQRRSYRCYFLPPFIEIRWTSLSLFAFSRKEGMQVPKETPSLLRSKVLTWGTSRNRTRSVIMVHGTAEPPAFPLPPAQKQLWV